MKNLTGEEYKQKLEARYGNRFTVLSEYVGGKYPIKILCNVCGNIKEETATQFLYRGSCSKCANINRIKSKTEFTAALQEKYGHEFELIGEYTGSRAKVRVRHNNCGSVYTIQAYNLLKNGSCKRCQPQRVKDTYLKHYKKEFEDYVNTKLESEYEVIGVYEHAEKPMLMRHKTCGHEWMSKPNIIKQGHRCPYCAYVNNGNKSRLDQQEYESRVSALYGDAYTVMSEYNGKSKTIVVRHNKCGHIWQPNAGNFIGGYGCPHCMESKGEKRIYQYLLSNEVNFKTQHRIKACRDKLPLPFDFAVFGDDGLDFLIEYDGEQHFIRLRHRDLDYTQMHDRIKDEYCKGHGIVLLRIKYTDDVDAALDAVFRR